MNERASERVIGRVRLFVYLVVDAQLRLTNATHKHARCRGCSIGIKEKCTIFSFVGFVVVSIFACSIAVVLRDGSCTQCEKRNTKYAKNQTETTFVSSYFVRWKCCGTVGTTDTHTFVSRDTARST